MDDIGWLLIGVLAVLFRLLLRALSAILAVLVLPLILLAVNLNIC